MRGQCKVQQLEHFQLGKTNKPVLIFFQVPRTVNPTHHSSHGTTRYFHNIEAFAFQLFYNANMGHTTSATTS